MCKPPAANALIRQSKRMAGGRKKGEINYELARSELQRIFVERLQEEMAARGLSDNALSALVNPEAPAKFQSNISRITACKQDPKLEMVERIAKVLGLPTIALLTPMSRAPSPRKVVDFPKPPPIFGHAAKPNAKKSDDRKKSTR